MCIRDRSCRDLSRMFGGLTAAVVSLIEDVIKMVHINSFSDDEEIKNFTNGESMRNIDRSMDLIVPAFEREFSILKDLEWGIVKDATYLQRYVILASFVWFVLVFLWFSKRIVSHEVKQTKVTKFLELLK
eukprot:TRINITY_DN1280_c0_g1_i4.p1 TRINITY_DN1280_c0_g1~~TRINITY_DN1280_c0_g1_i4.p1  ORF type:complete len:130 (-),score=26.84 TRINITY_DN1280_c0_g1_i4:152-541(-)